MDIYFGYENIGNYTQKQAIMNPQNPFDESFDVRPAHGTKILFGNMPEILKLKT